MIKQLSKIIWIVLAVVGVSLGIIYPKADLQTSTKGVLSAFDKFQVLSPMGYGVVISDGVSTTSLTTTNNPTFSSLSSTSTVATSTFAGNLSSLSSTAWGYMTAPFFQATSTTATSSLQHVSTTGISITGESTGCAQFGSGGYLKSTGVACGSGGGGGTTIKTIAATSSVTGSSAYVAPATTTPVTSGDRLVIWASCESPVSQSAYLQVGITGGATTTLMETTQIGAGTYQTKPYALFGTWIAPSTGDAQIEITDTSGVLIANCFSPAIMYFKI